MKYSHKELPENVLGKLGKFGQNSFAPLKSCLCLEQHVFDSLLPPRGFDSDVKCEDDVAEDVIASRFVSKLAMYCSASIA